MEKISKVVPSTVKNKIDMSRERPMRSGAPNYGAPIAHSAITLRKIEEAKMEQEKIKQAEQAQRSGLGAKIPDSMSPQEFKHSEIVDKVTLSFNANKKNEAPVQIEMIPSTMVEEMSIEDMEDMSDIKENLVSPQEREGGLSLYA